MKLQIVRMSAVLFLATCLLSFPATLQAQASKPNEKLPSQSLANSSPVNVEELVRAFTAKETEFRHALAEYAFTRDATVQTVGMGGQITGEYHRTSQFVFNDNNERFEKITLPSHRKTSRILAASNRSPSKRQKLVSTILIMLAKNDWTN